MTQDVHLSLTIHFNGPFRVGSGHAGDTLDEVLNRGRLLPASSLKGVMREAARLLRPRAGANDDPLVAQVFGTPRSPSPWHWDDASFAEVPTVVPRVRIALDTRKRPVAGALVVKEEAWTACASTEIWLHRPLAADRLNHHLALLNLAARLVEGLGADRRRGSGWVTITTNRSVADDISFLTTSKEESP